MLKKVDKDPFSNGSEYADWDSHNCERCVKASRYRGESVAGEEYTKGRCAIQRDIISRMMSNEPIAQRTIEACSHWDCPYHFTVSRSIRKPIDNLLLLNQHFNQKPKRLKSFEPVLTEINHFDKIEVAKH